MIVGRASSGFNCRGCDIVHREHVLIFENEGPLQRNVYVAFTHDEVKALEVELYGDHSSQVYSLIVLDYLSSGKHTQRRSFERALEYVRNLYYSAVIGQLSKDQNKDSAA